MLRFVFIFLALFALSPVFAAPAFEVLAEFERAGTIPTGRIVQHPDGNFYGCTISGGVYERGTVFKMTPSGAVSTLVSFTGTSGSARGASPSDGLVVGADGSLYGSTLAGGQWEFGTIFKVTPSGVFTNLVEFTGTSGLMKGAVPNPLLLHADGNFYGTTQAGGVNDFGTAFKMTALGGLTTIAEFTGTTGSTRGIGPIGVLTADATKVYGTAQYGGAYDLGTVFSIRTADSDFTTLIQFSGTTGIGAGRRGGGPVGGVLVVGTTLFGTTEMGGLDDLGTLFRCNLTGGAYAVLRDFAGPDGSGPTGQLTLGPDGLLYGTASTGGDNDLGVIFRISTAATPNFFMLASFSESDGATPGANPRSALSVGADGALYGTTEGGGAAENGTVFRITTQGEFSSLAAFTNTLGWGPAAAPLVTPNGLIIPMAHGGAKGYGVSLRFMPLLPPVVEHAFDSEIGSPVGGFIPFSGYLYGLSGDGVFFQLADGIPPLSLGKLGAQIGEGAKDLVRSADGYFYGVSEQGGAFDDGAVFRLSNSGGKELIASFNGTNGEKPEGRLVIADDGSFLGTTRKGGGADSGTVFRVTPDGVITTLASFTQSGPHEPRSGLVKSIDGSFYGTTSGGGAGDHGTVFRVGFGIPVTTIAEFTGEGGARPGAEPGRLCVARDGTIYGVAAEGGTGNGTIFRISPSGVFSTVIQFTGNTGTARGKAAETGISIGPGGALFGVAPEGGAGGGGTAFRIVGTGPHVSTDVPTPLANSTLLLSATAQLGGEVTDVVFDYGTTPAFGQVTPLVAIAPTTNSEETVSAQIPQPLAGQTVYFRARATNANGTSTGKTMSFGPSSQWKLANLGDAFADDLGDPDGDGVPTVLEYALCMSPTSANSTPPAQRGTFAEGPRLTMNLLRDPLRADITIEVRSAPGAAGPWTVVASSVNGAAFSGPGYVSGEVAGTAPRTVVIKDSAATNADKTRFMQIRVVH